VRAASTRRVVVARLWGPGTPLTFEALIDFARREAA